MELFFVLPGLGIDIYLLFGAIAVSSAGNAGSSSRRCRAGSASFSVSFE